MSVKPKRIRPNGKIEVHCDVGNGHTFETDIDSIKHPPYPDGSDNEMAMLVDCPVHGDQTHIPIDYHDGPGEADIYQRVFAHKFKRAQGVDWKDAKNKVKQLVMRSTSNRENPELDCKLNIDVEDDESYEGDTDATLKAKKHVHIMNEMAANSSNHRIQDIDGAFRTQAEHAQAVQKREEARVRIAQIKAAIKERRKNGLNRPSN